MGRTATQLTSAGWYAAQWILLVDNNTADNNQIVYVDVDATDSHGNQTVLASLYITREQFNVANAYQAFSLPFYLGSAYLGQTIQLRVLWMGNSYVREKSLDYDTETVWSQTFGYDVFGNLTKNGSASFHPTYNTSTNRIASVTGCTATYDANGNTLYDCLHNYTWDAEGRPTSIDGIGLTYDALERMVEQNRSGSYTQILYGPDGGKLALMNGQTVAKAFIPLPAGATAVYTVGPTLSYFRHPDWLGSVRFASTPARTMYSDLAYAPFGETYAEAGTPDRSFAGMNQDTIQGSTAAFYDATFREYAMYGRWVSPDPAGLGAAQLGNPQTWNRYAYVINNPLALVDPMGLEFGVGNKPDFRPRATSCIIEGEMVPDCGQFLSRFDEFDIYGSQVAQQRNVAASQQSESGPIYEWVPQEWDIDPDNGAPRLEIGVLRVGSISISGSSSIDWAWWGTFAQTFFSWQNTKAAQTDAWNKGYYKCLAKKNLPGASTVATVHAVGEVAAHAAENHASSMAGAYYHLTDGRFTAWGKYSKVLVPEAAATIKLWAKRLNAVGWAYADYELAKSIGECSESLR